MVQNGSRQVLACSWIRIAQNDESTFGPPKRHHYDQCRFWSFAPGPTSAQCDKRPFLPVNAIHANFQYLHGCVTSQCFPPDGIRLRHKKMPIDKTQYFHKVLLLLSPGNKAVNASSGCPEQTLQMHIVSRAKQQDTVPVAFQPD